MRATSPRFGRWIDGLLGGFRVQDKAQFWYSIFPAEEGSERALGTRPYHVMYKGGQNFLRTLHLKTWGRTLLADIQNLLLYEQDDAIYVDCALVSVDGVKALIAGDWVWFLHNLGRRVERSGVTLPVATTTAIEHRTGKAAPTSSPLIVPAGAFDQLEEIAPDNGPAERSLLEQRTSVDLVCLPGWPDELFQPISKGKAVHEMVHRTLNIRQTRGMALQGLARLAEKAPCFEVRSVTASELLVGLKEAASRHAPPRT